MKSEFNNILRFIISDILSGFGAWVSFIGLNWYLLEKTHLSSIVGLQMSVYTIAGLVISPFAGILIDNYNRKIIIIISNFIRILAILLVTVFLWFDYYNLYLILILSIINGMGFTIYTGCSRALVQQITNESNISKTNSLMEVSLQIGSFTAAGLSGIIYTRFGIISIMVINALCFVISNIFLFYVSYETVSETLNNQKWTTSIYEGFKFLKQNYDVAIIGSSLYIPLLISSALNVVFPAYISNVLKESTVTYGIIQMSYGIGATIAGLVFSFITLRQSNNKAFSIFLFVASAVLLGYFNFTKSIFVVISLIFMFGIINTVIRIILNTYIMEKVEKIIIGRVITTLLFVTRFIQSIILYLIGLEIDRFPIYFGFATLSGVSLFGAAGLWIVFRNYSRSLEKNLDKIINKA